nr:hypothetical protein [Spirochaetota bacterium]
MNEVHNKCPNCGAAITIDDDMTVGRHYTCPYCRTILNIKPEERIPAAAPILQSSIVWSIEISDSNVSRGKQTIHPRYFLFLLPVFILVAVTMILRNAGISIPGFGSSGKVTCSGTKLLHLHKKKISSLVARENCRVILNNVEIDSSGTGITAKDNANITAVNSTVHAAGTAVIIRDSAEISLVSSTVTSSGTAFVAKGKSLIKIINCTASGRENLYIRDKTSRIHIIGSTLKGKKVEL